MDIILLDNEKYKGYKFIAKYKTDKYYDVIILENGFELVLTDFEEGPVDKEFEMDLFLDYLEDPFAFGIVENNKLVAFVEGSLEKWHKIFRINNVYVSEDYRKKGIAMKLMNKMIDHVKANIDCRGILLETQTCNYPAISLYYKLGFNLSKIDINEYTNQDIENKELRIDLILKF